MRVSSFMSKKSLALILCTIVPLLCATSIMTGNSYTSKKDWAMDEKGSVGSAACTLEGEKISQQFQIINYKLHIFENLLIKKSWMQNKKKPFLFTKKLEELAE